MAELHVVVATPEQKVVEATAHFVVLPLYDGQKGGCPNHAPLMGRLGAGLLRIDGKDGSRHFYVEGGFVDVNSNQVSVLTPYAVPVEQLEEELIVQQLLELVMSRRAADPEEWAQQQHQIETLRIKRRLASRYA